jgi:hypothetical protein
MEILIAACLGVALGPVFIWPFWVAASYKRVVERGDVIGRPAWIAKKLFSSVLAWIALVATIVLVGVYKSRFHWMDLSAYLLTAAASGAGAWRYLGKHRQ